MTAKKSESSELPKVEKVKQVGNNLIFVIGGKQYSKAIVDKTERESIKNKILLYSKRPSKAGLDFLIKYFDKAATKKETLIAKSKGVKKLVKKQIETKKEKKGLVNEIAKIQRGDLSNVDISKSISKLQALLDKNKKVEAVAQKAVVSETSRQSRREY